eukprot:8824008-Pyramimonas_sp.AAC.1
MGQAGLKHPLEPANGRCHRLVLVHGAASDADVRVGQAAPLEVYSWAHGVARRPDRVSVGELHDAAEAAARVHPVDEGNLKVGRRVV